MSNSSYRLLLAAATLCLLVSGCGGGGGGGGSASTAPPPDPAPPPPAAELFSVSGTITASSSQAADSDNNDPARTAISNDSFDTAQPIPNPITLGGYVNEPGAGAQGRSRDIGDVDDYFRVELLAGQRVTMLVADYSQADADLYLYNSQGDTIDFSLETGEVESVLAPTDGDYLVQVNAFSGATNYILAIGTGDTLAVNTPYQHDFVPWQTIVKYRNAQRSTVAQGNTTEQLDYLLGLEQRGGGPGRGRLLALRPDMSALARQGRRTAAMATLRQRISDPYLLPRWETLISIKYLQQDPRVEYALPNYRLRSQAIPDDPAYPFQWHYPLINLPQAWDTTAGDTGVIVAVVDTGILADHPDLAGQWVPGYDFVSDPASALDGDGIDADPEDTGDRFGSGSFHGSHVGGTVAARSNNGRGVAGVAYGARIMPLRALGAGGAGTLYDIQQAVRFAAGLPNDSGTVPGQPADIINLSLGGAPYVQSAQDLFNEVRELGLVVVASAGNQGSSLPSYPASYDGVISVSAIDAQRRLAPYSNRGMRIDLAAPGGNPGEDFNGDGYPDGVLSTGGSVAEGRLNYEYVFLVGTSMAAPHVAGVFALMKSVNPELTPQDFDVLLETGQISDDLGAPGRDNLYGHGLINAQRAVLAALEASGSSPADTPRLVASSSTLNFSSTETRLRLALSNAGLGELELLELTVSEPWLSLDPLIVDDSGLGTYWVSVNRSGLDVGVYSAVIHARSNVNELDVSVLVSVGGADAVADVGLVYILLFEPGEQSPVSQVVASADEGQYRYRFDGVPAGVYEVLAGSDADNDLLICDSGEACGAWLTLDQPRLLDLQSDTGAVDFPIEYQVALPSIPAAPSAVSGSGSSKDTPGGIAKFRQPADD